MSRLRRPTEGEIGARLGDAGLQLSYTEVGASKTLRPPPASLAAIYNIDHYEFEIGHGPAAYLRPAIPGLAVGMASLRDSVA